METKEKQKDVKKCTRCRVKRTDEPQDQLAKYSTCFNCRNKRKVNKTPEVATLPGAYYDYNSYLERLKLNSSEEMHDVRFRGQTKESEFPRADADEDVALGVYQHYATTLTERYILPISQATGYKFAVRDYHKGGHKVKKITFTFICSQDKGRQRKSRSNQERNVNNKLKTEYCGSRLSLTYNLNDGYLNIVYSHKPHTPYGAMKHIRASRNTSTQPDMALANNLSTQLPPLQMPVRSLDYNLGSVAQYNTQVQLGMVGDRTKEDQVFSDQYVSSDKAQAAEALRVVAAASAQYKKISDENIDKELIGLNE